MTSKHLGTIKGGKTTGHPNNPGFEKVKLIKITPDEWYKGTGTILENPDHTGKTKQFTTPGINTNLEFYPKSLFVNEGFVFHLYDNVNSEGEPFLKATSGFHTNLDKTVQSIVVVPDIAKPIRTLNNDDVQSETNTEGFHMKINNDIGDNKFFNLDKVGYYNATNEHVYTWHAGDANVYVNVFGDDYYGIIYSNNNMAVSQLIDKKMGKTNVKDDKIEKMIGIYIGRYSHKYEPTATIE